VRKKNFVLYRSSKAIQKDGDFCIANIHQNRVVGRSPTALPKSIKNGLKWILISPIIYFFTLTKPCFRARMGKSICIADGFWGCASEASAGGGLRPSPKSICYADGFSRSATLQENPSA